MGMKKFLPLVTALVIMLGPAGVMAEKVFVSGQTVNIRSGPSTRHSIVRTARMGDELELLKSLNGWARVILPDGETGWVHERLISSTRQSPSSETVYVTADKVNVRKGPGTNYSIVTMAKKNNELKRTKSLNGWARVTLPDGKTGWITEKYVSTIAQLPAEADTVLQFRSFQLGSSKEDILQQLKEEGYSFDTDSEDVRARLKELFGHECTIGFHFTPKSLRLYKIELVWPQMDVSERAKHVLMYKYGKPKRKDMQSGNLIWADGNVTVVLDANMKETRLFYLHDQLTRLFDTEREG
ncbi:MAG: SH3 domain-containing protein [bacterium]